MAIPFLDACLAMRLPDKGAKDQTLKPIDPSKAWLAPLLGEQVGEKAEPAASYQGNPNRAAGALADSTPPPNSQR